MKKKVPDPGDRVKWVDMYEQEHVGTIDDKLSVQWTVECDDGKRRFLMFSDVYEVLA